jgi:hypothetical protein
VITISRYDKYEPNGGGFRAPLAAAWDATNKGKIFGVGIDTNGRAVKGGGQSGIKGVFIANVAKVVGDIADIMTDGEVVDFKLSDGVTAVAAGTSVYAIPADGTLTVTAAGNVYVGHTVEASRLVVRAAR